ncbi:unnamed protein product [Ceratitis capitata]|uniref:(Mediterranean fruit fly) hypothetical protein n=1 Tax=Ceratitis capitata TaxID=7213 RepID=A0A811V1Y2_CERCA|nr:unnamed protein product [Ceratitis capitata]
MNVCMHLHSKQQVMLQARATTTAARNGKLHGKSWGREKKVRSAGNEYEELQVFKVTWYMRVLVFVKTTHLYAFKYEICKKTIKKLSGPILHHQHMRITTPILNKQSTSGLANNRFLPLRKCIAELAAEAAANNAKTLDTP